MSSIYRELSYNQEIDVVRGIHFSVLGPDEIVRRSVVEVTKTDTYAGNEPVVGGLFDPRMGVLEHNRYCSTCEQKNIFCPGHFGHITLARPVFHPMFFETVRKLLKCVCYRCSRPMVSVRSTKEGFKDEIKRIQQIKNNQKRWDAFVKLCGNTRLKRCGDDEEEGKENTGCMARQPSRYNKEGAMKITAEWKDSSEVTHKEFSAEEVLRIFKRICDADIELMGFHPQWNRPDWMICTVLPVPPPAVRPSIIEENGQRREDDLTHKLSDIVKFNMQLKQRIDTGKGTEEHLKVLTNLVQYHVATFMDNQIPGLPVAQQRNGRKLKSIADRLRKKEGRIRGNLNGKRVDQSARSVITPDPNIGLDELGVPVRIAMNITFPESVNRYNLKEMQQLVRNGPDIWPGAKYVRLNNDGVTKTLKYADRNKIADELQDGDIVDRHMRDGDYILFNRQPSLHKMSMMCHKVRVMPYQTFRLNVLVTAPYNADFDGDEMNLFMGQNVQTMSELMDLAAVPYMIIAPRDGKPIVEVVQDSMLGSFRLTKDWVRIHEKTMANLQMVNSYFSGVMPKPTDDNTHEYTGKQAFTEILPPGLFIESRNKAGEKFKIHNSELVSGSIDKGIYHSITKGIVPVLFHDYSPFEARRFLDNIQRLVMRWLTTAGFSVGISDLVTDKSTNDKLKEAISSYKGRAYNKIEEVRKGNLENLSIFTNEDYFEREILNILNDLTKVVGKIGLEQIDEKSNRMINMVKSGSKGKETNVAQMIACVGQQNVDGKRVAYGFTDRTLPHYTKYDDGPEARGFVENSFISGLSPQEVFFHAMGGREGLIDTAVKTSETGYIQRRLVKAMEDCKIYYDQTVRNATGTIIQFLYGEDGMDGSKIERQHIPTIDMNLFQLDAMYHLRPEDNLNLYLKDEALEQMKKESEWIEKSDKHFEEILDDRVFLIDKVFGGQKNDKIEYPIPFERILRTAQQRIHAIGCNGVPTDLTPNYILDKMKELKDKLYIMRPNQGVRFIHILLNIYLSPKPLITQYYMPVAVFDWVVSEIERYFIESVAQAGEMVGIIAAQSLGELNTQLTLDSFHSSGTAAAVKATSGVPRLKELLSVSKNIKTPTMLIYLKNDISSVRNPVEDEEGNVIDPRVQEAKERSINILHQLETTRLLDLLDGTEIYWDPPGENGLRTGIDEDQGMLEVYRAFAEVHKCRSTSPWVLRMKINREKLYRLGLSMTDIYMRIQMAYQQQVECLFSDDNAQELVMRIRLTKEALKDVDTEDVIAALKAMEHNLVHQVLLKGMRGIKKVSMRLKTQDSRNITENEFNQQEDNFDKVAEWMLDTDGTNLIEILANPNIDAHRTRSNDVWEIYRTLGIEAARNALHQEFAEVVGEDALNYRHMSLLLDTMTNRGTLMSVDRHGINRGDGGVGPLAKSSFEETTDMLINASIFSEHDRINGVSANIMLGQLPPCGTGDHDVLLDEEAYIRILEERNIKDETIVQYDNEENLDDIPESCSVDVISLSYKIPSKPKKTLKKQNVTFA